MSSVQIPVLYSCVPYDNVVWGLAANQHYNAENLLKSYGVGENTLTDARIYFEENVATSENISQTAKTVKDSFEKARDMFGVNFENVRNLEEAKTEVQVVKASQNPDQ